MDSLAVGNSVGLCQSKLSKRLQHFKKSDIASGGFTCSTMLQAIVDRGSHGGVWSKHVYVFFVDLTTDGLEWKTETTRWKVRPKFPATL